MSIYTEHLDKNSPNYERLGRLIWTFEDTAWQISRGVVTAIDRSAGRTNTSQCQHFKVTDLNELSPILVQLINREMDMDQAPHFNILKPSWDFWHKPGLYYDEKETAHLFIRNITDVNFSAGLLETKNRTNVIAQGYFSYLRNVSGIKCSFATELHEAVLLKNNFIEENFPALMAAFALGKSLGMPSVDIKDQWLQTLKDKNKIIAENLILPAITMLGTEA